MSYDFLPVLVPTFGAALLFTCVNGCFLSRLFGKVRALQAQINSLENRQAQPQIVVAQQPQPIRYQPPYYPAPVPGIHATASAPVPSAPPASYTYAGPRMV